MCFHGSISMDMFPWRMCFHGCFHGPCVLMEAFPWICFHGECVSMDVSKDSVFPWTMCFDGSISMDMFPWRMSFHGRVSNDNMFPWTMCFPPYTWCRDMEMLYWSFVRGIHQWLMDSSHKSWVMCSFDFFFVYAWTTCWITSIVLGDSRFHDVCCNKIQNISDSMWTKFPYTANCMIYMYNKYIRNCILKFILVQT